LQVKVLSLSLVSPGLANPIKVDVSKAEDYKKSPITIKEGAEYNVEITFQVDNGIVPGLKYLQVVKRAGVKG
jgi:Rho GDP-dissociation inhibitor